MKKKKGIYCEICQSEVTVYKKGKKRVWVCPIHGVLMHNPIPLIMAAASALAPTVIDKATSFLNKPKKEKANKENEQRIITDSLDKPNITRGDYLVRQVMKDEDI